MKEDNKELILEIREMVKVLAENQEKLLKAMGELIEEQKRLHEEIKINNFVLNNITVRNEILN